MFVLRKTNFYQWLLLLLLVIGSQPAIAAPWWDCAWPYRTEVTVTSTQAATNRVVELDLSGADFNAGYLFTPDGADIRLLAADNLNELDFHLVSWDAITLQALINVRIPNLSTTTPETVYVYYGNGTVAGASAVVTANDPVATYVNTGWRFDVRASSFNPSNEAQARAQFESALSPGGYGCTIVSEVLGRNKRNTFGGSRNNYALLAETWFEVTTPGQWQFRVGADYGRGGDFFIDGVAMTNRWNEDIWWAYNYNNSDVLTGSVNLSAGFHHFEMLGFEGCCDGTVSVQYLEPGSGQWAELNSTNLTALNAGCPVGSQNALFVQTDAPNRFGGTAFLDNGDNGVAHNAIREGNEAAVTDSDITIEIVSTGLSNTVSTQSDGSWSTCFLDDAIGQDVLVSMATPQEHYSVSEGLSATNNDVSLNATVLFPVAAATNYLDITLGFIKFPELVSDNSINVGTGQTGLLPHRYTPSSSAKVNFQVSQVQHQLLGVYDYSVFRDMNCDGNLDDPANPLTGALSVEVGTDVCLLIKVDGSASVVQSSVLELRVDANTNFDGVGVSHANTNFDTVDGLPPIAMVLVKTVCNETQNDCNLATGDGFSENEVGVPTDELVYRLEFSSSQGNLSNVKVYDAVPVYTKLKPLSVSIVSQPTGLSCVMVEPSDQTASGFTGTIQWDCDGQMPASQSGVLAFSVYID